MIIELLFCKSCYSIDLLFFCLHCDAKCFILTYQGIFIRKKTPHTLAECIIAKQCTNEYAENCHF